MVVATAQRRERLIETVKRALSTDSVIELMSTQLRNVLSMWLLNYTDHHICRRAFEAARELLPEEATKHPLISDINLDKDLVIKISQWIVGGDGWAYDIGYGGLDHVVASGVDVNIVVMDTEVYSNTGGQCSKATPMGAVHKFASTGKTSYKKDLGAMCMEYGNVYVASVASSANMAHTVRAMVEAESFAGVAVIMAYSPCIEHQYLKPFNTQIEHCTKAVESGYWPLYRHDPRLADKGLPPLQLDSKKVKADIVDLMRRENRFALLRRTNPTLADDLENRLRKWACERVEALAHKAAGKRALLAPQKHNVDPEQIYNVLFGTDTGNSEQLAGVISKNLESRGLVAPVTSLGDVTVDDIAGMKNVLIVCSTIGQGAFPPNAKAVGDELHRLTKDSHTALAQTKYAVMGLGDSSYVFFNGAARKFDQLFSDLGATRLISVGLGDEQADGGYDLAYQDWIAELLLEIKAPAPLDANDDPLPSVFTVQCIDAPLNQDIPTPTHEGLVPITLNSNIRMTPSDYEVDIRHLRFDVGLAGLKYALGDSLSMMPQNLHNDVIGACTYLNIDPDQWIKIEANTDSVPTKYISVFQHPMTITTLLTEVLDLFGRPTRFFFFNVYRYATDAKEKEILKSLLDKENKDLLKDLTVMETVSYLDILMKYSSIRLTLEQLLDLVPLLRARYYSIASSQKFVGEDNLELCVGVVQWNKAEHRITGPWTAELTGDKRVQYGTMTGNLPVLVGG
eukprot:Protomagalhaensia_sp_Gyna_25__4849@NODE_502_length_3259_cov_256_463354_g393_i0_p1_GENE_NODE_502_length_3259_cov_256_463354_g393_i0NODE_502_length_3259_cov_256_463354_g393_i0_p1_ORF_typecomplete_len862_score189_10FAD_binding_1/PF00667_20/1_8e46Flavodoxin_1/PF00258_25/2e31TPP_enzyme_C/PF02775_21/2_6e02TPP_enzyme_C/PF02775_21/1_6e14Flavodoxin_5/PF12724_7/0_0023Flavodoxin_3/PF12641_7/0_15_NODE_502_length_3259_cov_256_463354_g393_i06732886